MSTKINWVKIADALFSCPVAMARLHYINTSFPMPDDRQTFMRALTLTFTKDQPINTEPLAATWSNDEVFKAAVWAIGSNMRDWDVFLKTEPQLRILLCNYNPVHVQTSINSGSITLATLTPYFPGTTSGKDSKAIIAWAQLLNSYPNYYDHLVAVAQIFYRGLIGYSIAPAPYSLPELTICLAGYFADPPGRWPGRGCLPPGFPSFSKWPGMRYTLGIEFLRNLGWPAFKPDRHIRRLFDTWIPSHHSNRQTDANEERLARMIGSINQELLDFIHYAQLGISLAPPPDAMSLSLADNFLWLVGAEVETKAAFSKGLKYRQYLSYNTNEPNAPFRRTQVADLCGSGWTQWVQEILQDMTIWQLGDFAPLGRNRVLKQLSSLQAILLVSENGMRDIRNTWVCGEDDKDGDFDWWKDQWGPNPHGKDDDSQSENEDLPIDSPDEQETDNQYQRDFPAPVGNGVDEVMKDNFCPHGPEDRWDERELPPYQEPCYGGEEGEKMGVVVIETYGIYLESLANFVYASNWAGNALPLLKDLQNYLKQNPQKSGPTIILCPNLIKKIPAYLQTDIEKIDPGRRLPDGHSATMFSLRKILLHEMGHHLFARSHYSLHPHHYSELNRACSESLANWFCYQMMSPWERDLLFAFSQKQPFIYRLYTGLVVLQQKEAIPGRVHGILLAFYQGKKIDHMPRSSHTLLLMYLRDMFSRRHGVSCGLFAAFYFASLLG